MTIIITDQATEAALEAEAPGVDSAPGDANAAEPSPPAAQTDPDAESTPAVVADGETDGDGAAPSGKPPEELPAEKKPEEEQGLGRAQLQLKKDRAKFEERRSQHARERQEFEREKQQWGEHVQTAQRQIEESRKDPVGWLARVHGISEEDLARRILNGGQASPQEEQTAASKRIEALEKQIADDKKTREDREQMAQLEAAEREAKADFVRLTRDNKAKYPTLNRIYESDSELADDAAEWAQKAWMKTAKRNPVTGQLYGGKVYSNKEVAEFLEGLHGKRYGKTQTTPEQGKGGDAKSAATRVAPKGPENRSGHEGHMAGDEDTVPTLSSRKAAERASTEPDPLALYLEDEAKENELVKLEIERARKARQARTVA